MSEHILNYGNTQIPYRLTFSERATLAIHVHPDLSVLVEAPQGSEPAEIEKRLRKRAAWILRQQRDFQRYSLGFPPRQYVSGESYRYLGQQVRLKVIQSTTEPESVRLDRDIILVTVRDKQETARVKKQLTQWYRQQAQALFGERLVQWFPHFERLGSPSPRILVREMRTRWGSCTPQGTVTLNLKLIMVPKQLIDYVVVHELCHLVEPNHGKAFFDLLSRIMPNWEEQKEHLDRFEFG